MHDSGDLVPRENLHQRRFVYEIANYKRFCDKSAMTGRKVIIDHDLVLSCR
jgi:hypothetical protein